MGDTPESGILNWYDHVATEEQRAALVRWLREEATPEQLNFGNVGIGDNPMVVIGVNFKDNENETIVYGGYSGNLAGDGKIRLPLVEAVMREAKNRTDRGQKYGSILGDSFHSIAKNHKTFLSGRSEEVNHPGTLELDANLLANDPLEVIRINHLGVHRDEDYRSFNPDLLVVKFGDYEEEYFINPDNVVLDPPLIRRPCTEASETEIQDTLSYMERKGFDFTQVIENIKNDPDPSPLPTHYLTSIQP